MEDIKLGGYIQVPYSQELRSLVYLKYLYTETRSEESVTAVKIDKVNNIMYFPRNITKFASAFPNIINYNVIDQRVSCKVPTKLELIEGFKPRYYQEEALTKIEDYHNRDITDLILEAKAGSGKSYMMSAYIVALQERTLILVDRSLLANQMFEEISTNTTASVQLLTKDTVEVADVNIATFQLMSKNPQLIALTYKKVGSIIVDETHIVGAKTFLQTVQCYAAKYRIGLSATPFRSDGLTNLIFDVMGHHKVYAHNPENLKVQIHKVHNSEVFIVSSVSRFKREKTEFLLQPSIVTKITELLTYLLKKDRAVLLACDSIMVQKAYSAYLENLGISTGIVNGSTTKKKREEILAKFEKGEIDVLLAFSVLEKGISIKRLDTIVSLVSPTEGQIIQLVGRLRRDHPTKGLPLYIDMFFEGNFKRAQSIKEQTFNQLIYSDGDKVMNFRDFATYKKKWL